MKARRRTASPNLPTTAPKIPSATVKTTKPKKSMPKRKLSSLSAVHKFIEEIDTTNHLVRGQLERDILQQAENEVEQALLLHASPSWSDGQCEAVEQAVLNNMKIMLAALSTSELQLPGAARLQISRAVAETERMIRMDEFVNAVLVLLARSRLMFDDDMAAAVIAGKMRPMEETVTALVIRSLDAKTVVTDRRTARSCLAIAFLTAIACTKNQENAM
jgi:hypothetical protein